jgi:aminopeptidase-like protein
MTTMLDLINELWFLRRDIVSNGYDQALFRLAKEVPLTIHEYPTGEACWTWRIPEKWSVDEAYLETLDGRRLVDAAKNPLHVISYSLPFEGVINRNELLPHLHTHPSLPHAIPFVFKYYDRDWGLCLSRDLKDTLQDEVYRVVIHTRFEPGILKVGEVVVKGQSSRTFMLVAHLCHPAMVNDDLTGVVVGVDLMRRLLAGPQPYYTYRFLILPETIGSVAWLSHHEELIPDMAGGLFLEGLGADLRHVLQTSMNTESQADRCLVSALRGLAPEAVVGGYRRVIDNDERQFNAPGVRVPMLSIARVVPEKTAPDWPFHEYHSSDDNPSIVTQARLEDSRDLALNLLEAWERNQYVVNQFKGEIFCSGNKIWIDYQVNPEGHRRLFEIMERCDGTRTVADLASELQISFQSVWEIVALLQERNLIRLSRLPEPTAPKRDFPL